MNYNIDLMRTVINTSIRGSCPGQEARMVVFIQFTGEWPALTRRTDVDLFNSEIERSVNFVAPDLWKSSVASEDFFDMGSSFLLFWVFSRVFRPCHNHPICANGPGKAFCGDITLKTTNNKKHDTSHYGVWFGCGNERPLKYCSPQGPTTGSVRHSTHVFY